MAKDLWVCHFISFLRTVRKPACLPGIGYAMIRLKLQTDGGGEHIMGERTYLAVDLKSFYASVECVERGLDPLTTNLVVADLRRTDKTICLAVTPSLKAWGISGRARLFEVVQRGGSELHSRTCRNPSGHTYRSWQV